MFIIYLFFFIFFFKISEARVLAKIPPSPYVISLVGICAEPFCLLTDFVDGGSLYEFLRVRNENMNKHKKGNKQTNKHESLATNCT